MPVIVVEGVTVPRNASTEVPTLLNVLRGECLHGLLQAVPGRTTDQRNKELKYEGLNDISTSCICTNTICCSLPDQSLVDNGDSSKLTRSDSVKSKLSLVM